MIDNYSAYSYEAGTTETVDADTVSTLSGVTVTDASYNAFSFEGGSVTISGCSGTTSSYSGLDLASTTADVQGNTFTGNAEYGMTCSDTTLTTCATNVLTDNTLGAHLDCSDSCSE